MGFHYLCFKSWGFLKVRISEFVFLQTINFTCQSCIRFYTFTIPRSQFADTATYLKHLMLNTLLKMHRGLFWENGKHCNKLRTFLFFYFSNREFWFGPLNTEKTKIFTVLMLPLYLQLLKKAQCEECISDKAFVYKLEKQRKILIIFPIMRITF